MNCNQRFVYRFALAAGMAALPAIAQAQNTVASAVVRDLAAEVACSAQSTTLPPDNVVRVGAGREHGKSLFGPGDPLIIRGGTAQGIKPGQDYFVRRVVADRFARGGGDGVKNFSIHTAGWIHIEDAQSDTAIATVTKACDGIMEGDYLEPFVKPALPPEPLGGEPDYNSPGHVTLGDERRQMGAAGDMMVVDRGSDHGVRPGQRLTIFRYPAGGGGPVTKVAEAIALAVKPESTIVRIEKVSDAVLVGDLVAIHR
jgi:hypothetical protein